MPGSISFFLLFLLPFLIAPFGVSAFESPKIIVAEASILILLLYFLFTKKIYHYSPLQLLLYTTILLLTVIDLLFFRTQLSFFGNVFRMQGIFLLWLLLLFSLLSSNVTFKKIPWLVFGLLVVLQTIALFFLPLNESQRYVGTFGEPNALGAFIIFLWPFAFFTVKKFGKREKIGMVLVFLGVIITLLLSGSKSAMIAFFIQMVCIWLSKKKFAKKKIVLICVVLYLLSYMIPFFEHIPYENRSEVWRSAVAAGYNQPFFGNGFGNMELVLHKAAHRWGLPVQYYYVDSSHNIFLDWWVQGGIVGFAVLVTLVYFSFEKFLTTDNVREFVLLLGMVTVLSFNPASIIGLLGFWWLIGQGMKQPS